MRTRKIEADGPRVNSEIFIGKLVGQWYDAIHLRNQRIQRESLTRASPATVEE
jgi:hypothetical protein